MRATSAGHRMHRRAAANAGSASIEFALCGTLLMALTIGVTELGFTLYQGMQVYNAAEAGALYAAKNGFNAAGIANAVVNASTLSGITATPAPSQFCGCPAAASITAASCGSTCASGSPAGQYIQINAALTRQTIMGNSALPLPTTLTAQSILRID